MPRLVLLHLFNTCTHLLKATNNDYLLLFTLFYIFMFTSFIVLVLNNCFTYRCSIPSDPRMMSFSTSVIIAKRMKFLPPRSSFLGSKSFDLKTTMRTSASAILVK